MKLDKLFEASKKVLDELAPEIIEHALESPDGFVPYIIGRTMRIKPSNYRAHCMVCGKRVLKGEIEYWQITRCTKQWGTPGHESVHVPCLIVGVYLGLLDLERKHG